MSSGSPTRGDSGGARTAGLRGTFPAPLLIALAALAAVAPLATDTYLPAFTHMAADLGTSASSVQLTMTTFLIGIAIGQLLIGVISDRFGRRPLLLAGTLLALVAGVLTALAPTIEVLQLARFLQGLGGAAGMVLGRAVIADRATGVAAAQALNVVMAIQGIAPVLAPIIGGSLVETIGWRGILGVVAAFTAVLLMLVVIWVPETLPPDERRSGGLGELRRGGRRLAGDALFVRQVVVAGLIFALLMAYLSAAPFVLQNVLGMGTAVFTAVFAGCAVMMTVATLTSSALARRITPARQARAGLLVTLLVDAALAGVCVVALGAPVSSTALSLAVIVLLLAHVASLGFSIGNVPALALSRSGRVAGTASALLGFAQFVLGGLVSPLVGLSGERSATAFGVVLLLLAVGVNVLALRGLHAPQPREHDVGTVPMSP